MEYLRKELREWGNLRAHIATVAVGITYIGYEVLIRNGVLTEGFLNILFFLENSLLLCMYTIDI